MKRRYIIVYLVLFVGCTASYDSLKLQKSNPVSYVFNFNKNEIRKVIKNKLEFPHGYRFIDLYFLDKDEIPSKCDSLKTYENVNDALLYSYDYIGKSFLHYRNLEFLDYWAAFHIHLKEINDSTTLVEIRTLGPYIFVDKGLFSKIFDHGPGSAIISKVKPSTIEEYEILLLIGEGLGVKEQMPKIVYPDTNQMKK